MPSRSPTQSDLLILKLSKDEPALRPVAILFVVATTLLLLAVACSGDPEPEPCVSSETVLCLTNQAGDTARLDIELADEPAERTKGLSMRDSLPENSGMLFVIENRGSGFWMKDTRIPLSVAFVEQCGQIVHIAHMQPLSLDIHQSPQAYRYGLEVNQGWFVTNGIAVGDRLELPAFLLAAVTCPAAGG